MNSDNQNLILAVVLSVMILMTYQIFLAPDTTQQAQDTTIAENAFPAQNAASGEAAASGGANAAPTAIATAPRLDIASPRLGGSISRAGGRLDDLLLLDYAQDDAEDADSERVHLLRATGSADSYFAEILFIDTAGNLLVPKDAVWNASGAGLTPAAPLTLTHSSDGVEYALEYRMDENYLITITARARNVSGGGIAMRPFARIRRNLPDTTDFFISYEGPLGVFAEGQKTEVDYDDIEDIGIAGETYRNDGISGWAGISDKYWLVALIPDSGFSADAIFTFRQATGAKSGDLPPTQVDVDTPAINLNAGEEMARVFHLYAGPKKVNILLDYSESLGVERLDHAIDWGWFPFLTKPFFHALNWFYGLFGNFGLAILALTVVVKAVFFPLANKSYHSMAKMRTLAPKMQEIRERFKDDRQRQQQETMELYRREKINPAAGCLPILLQIPVFFALYKVLFVTIEMRHAPFYGWITDLSAIDPTSIINLFGLLPYSTDAFPDIVNLGIWPILMGVSMFVQMSLNPPPPDPVQAKIFKLMPVFFTFLLATFPAGLVIYWTWNNLLSIIQQMVIMRSVKKEAAAPKK